MEVGHHCSVAARLDFEAQKGTAPGQARLQLHAVPKVEVARSAAERHSYLLAPDVLAASLDEKPH